MMSDRVLVTGGTGFIGTQLVRRLVADGHAVYVLVRPENRAASPNTAVITDPGAAAPLAELIVGRGIRTCFHLATKFVAQHSAADISGLIESNIGLGTRVAEAFRGSGATFVNVGTAWQHVAGASYRPASLYAATKQAFADVLRYYADAGLRVVNLKLFDTYGPNDPRQKLVGLLLRAAATGATLEMSPGDQLINLLHVDDVVAGLVAAAGAPDGDSHDWALSADAAITIRQLTALVAEVTGRPVNVHFGAKPYRPIEMFEPWDAGPVLERWTPRIPLEEGLRQVWEMQTEPEPSS